MLIPEKVAHKVRYLLSRFTHKEWSGPAWYDVLERQQNGFPAIVELTYFMPVDLGSHTATEVDGESFGKVLPSIYKKYSKLKECYLGLIHSHNTMGAFFSQTDTDTALEQAPQDGLFFSTIVASSKSKYEAGVSYRDQFGYPNFIEGEVEMGFQLPEADVSWKKEADKIEKEAKTAIPTVYNGWGHRIHNAWGSSYNSGSGLTPAEEDAVYNAYGIDKDDPGETINPNQTEITGLH